MRLGRARGEPNRVEEIKEAARDAKATDEAADEIDPAEQPGGELSTLPRLRPVSERPIVRAGIYAWAIVGLAGALVVVGFVIDHLRLVVIPLVLALFPAAILMPVAERLKRLMPATLAAILTIAGAVAVLSGIVAVLAPQVSDELVNLGDTVTQGAQDAQAFLESGPFGFQPVRIDDLVNQAQERLAATEGLAGNLLGAAAVVVEGFAGLLFGLVALFFYLADGPRISRALRNVAPPRFRSDASVIGTQAWATIGSYIRGQAFIAVIDAALIGIGIFLLGVPLALPLTVLVFFGGLFPIIGAFVSGAVAVLVALAVNGPGTALILLAVIVAVQQIEGHLLAPIVIGRAVELHPLVALGALTAGAVLLGVLGAFLALPVAASLSRAASYLRERIPD